MTACHFIADRRTLFACASFVSPATFAFESIVKVVALTAIFTRIITAFVNFCCIQIKNKNIGCVNHQIKTSAR